MARIAALVLAIAFASGCASDSLTSSIPPAVDHDAEGSWTENTHGLVVPGNSFLVSTAESSGVITGTGSFAGEAGPFGSLSVSGTVANDSLHLQIVYTLDPRVFPGAQPDTAQFDGVLTNRDQIDGTLTRGGAVPLPFGLIRLKPASDPV